MTIRGDDSSFSSVETDDEVDDESSFVLVASDGEGEDERPRTGHLSPLRDEIITPRGVLDNEVNDDCSNNSSTTPSQQRCEADSSVDKRSSPFTTTNKPSAFQNDSNEESHFVLSRRMAIALGLVLSVLAIFLLVCIAASCLVLVVVLQHHPSQATTELGYSGLPPSMAVDECNATVAVTDPVHHQTRLCLDAMSAGGESTRRLNHKLDRQRGMMANMMNGGDGRSSKGRATMMMMRGLPHHAGDQNRKIGDMMHGRAMMMRWNPMRHGMMMMATATMMNGRMMMIMMMRRRRKHKMTMNGENNVEKRRKMMMKRRIHMGGNNMKKKNNMKKISRREARKTCTVSAADDAISNNNQNDRSSSPLADEYEDRIAKEHAADLARIAEQVSELKQSLEESVFLASERQQLEFKRSVGRLESELAQQAVVIGEMKRTLSDFCEDSQFQKLLSSSLVWSGSQSSVATNDAGTAADTSRTRLEVLQCSSSSTVASACSRYSDKPEAYCPAILTVGKVHVWSLQVEDLPAGGEVEGTDGLWQLELGVVSLSSSAATAATVAAAENKELDRRKWLSQQKNGWILQGGPTWLSPYHPGRLSSGKAGHNGSWSSGHPSFRRGSKVTFRLDLLSSSGEGGRNGFGTLSVSVDDGPMHEIFDNMLLPNEIPHHWHNKDAMRFFLPAMSMAVGVPTIRVRFLGFE